MTVTHFKTSGMHCDQCPPRIEAELEHLPGVKRVVAFRDLGITSVMFDEKIVDAATIATQIAVAGFGTTVIAPSEGH